MRTIEQIIKEAGGARLISEASGPIDATGRRPLSYDAVYKWPKIGIPDRHWHIVMELTNATADELYRANLAVRGETV